MAVEGKFDEVTAGLIEADKIITDSIVAVEGKFDEVTAGLVEADKVIADTVKANKGEFDVLEAQVGEINNLISGNISSENIQTGGITGDNLNMKTIFVKDANILDLSASKLTAGEIDTSKIVITSKDGGMRLVGSTQQFIDENDRIRIQLGKDANGDFDFYILAENGDILFNTRGITGNAIANGLIKENMVSDGAIGGKKINWQSFTTEFNKDSNTHKLNSSKVLLDGTNQTLDIHFNRLNSTVNDNVSKTESNTTQLNVHQGKINTLIQDTTITKDGKNAKLKDEYSKLEQTVGGLKSTVGEQQTTINQNTGKITATESKVSTLEQTVNGFNSELSHVKTTIDEQEEAINSVSSALSGKANSSDVYKKTETMTTSAINSAIKQSADSINLGVSNTYETKSNVETKISTANTTTLNSAKSYADTKKNEAISSASADATSKVNSAKNELNTKIDGIQIGGRNLIRKADLSQHNSTATFDEKTNTWTINATAGNGGTWGCGLVVRYRNAVVPYGKTYILSFEIKVPKNCSWNSDINNYPITDSSWSGNDNDNSAKRSTSSKNLVANQWIKCWIKWENTSSNNTNKVDLFDNTHFGVVMTNETSDMTYQIRNVKGELGNMPTEWTPAPEDIQTDIDSKASKTDVYTKSEVYTKTQTDSAINVAKDSINLGVSQTYETKSNVESKISSANTNTLNSAKSYADTKKQEAISTASTDATNKVNSAKNELNTAINKKANSSDVYTKSQVYTKEETNSQIKVAKDEINLGVSNTYETKANVESKLSNTTTILTGKINELVVGGRNLWIKSKTTGYSAIEKLGDNHITGQSECYRINNHDTLTFNIEPEYSSRLYRKLTFSAWVKYENVVQGENSWNKFNVFKHSMFRKNTSSGNISSQDFTTLGGFQGSSDWKYVSYTYDYSANTLYDQLKTSLRFNVEGAVSGTAWVTGIKVEFGDKATDYSPAPEDVQANIDLKASKTDVYTKTETYTKSETDSKINIAKDSINLGVSQTYETKSNVETKISTANTTTLNSAKSYADTKKNEAISTASTDATNKVNSAKNELNTAINKKANSVDVYKKSETYTKSETDSKINIAKDQINLNVSNTYETKANVETKVNNAVNNIQVGGVNRLADTATSKNTNVNVPTSYVTFDPYTTPNKQTLEALGFKVGDKVTISFDWSISQNGSNAYTYGNFRLEFKGINSEGTDNQFVGVIKNPVATFGSSNTKGTEAITTTLNSDTIKAHTLRFRVDNSVLNFKVSNVKLEKGNKPTAWSQAPEDIDSAINKKANSTDVYKKTETYTKAQTDSAIKVAKDEINLGVKNTYETKSNVETKVNNAVNNIQIGGRNLWIEKNLINAYESNGNATSSNSQHKMMSTYTDLNSSKYVTVQLWNPNSFNNNSNSNRIAFYDSNKTWISSIGTPKPNGTTYVSGIITVPTNAKYMKIGMITGESQHESSIRIKVELGNKPSDWSPAPEDVDSEINKKANTTDVYNKSETYTKTETDSKIKVAQDNINLSVSQTYETKTNVETKINSAVNNVQVGGRNLFLNSGFTKGLNYWYTYNCSNPQAVADSSALSGYVVKFTSTGGGIYQRKGGVSNNPTNYPNGSVMTVSGYVKSSVANKVLRPNFEGAGANTSKAVTCINANTWYYFTHTYTINSSGFSTVTFYGDSGADYYLKDIILEYGNKASTWTSAPEDIDSEIETKANASDVYNKTEVYTKTETTSQINVAKDSITNTVAQTYLNKNDASNTYATKSSLTQTENSITAKFESSGGSNLVKNGAFKNGTAYWTKWGSPSTYQVQNSSNGYGQELRIVTTGSDQGAYQTIEGLRTDIPHTVVADVWVSSGICLMYINIGTTWWLSSPSSGTGWKKLSITFTPTSSTVKLLIGRGLEGANGDYRFTGIRMYEGSAIQSWTPHHSEVYNGSTVIDANGVTINNGALTVKNKSGTTVLSGDFNGNLVFTGTAKSQAGAMWASLDAGGLSLQDSQKSEQTLRIGTSYFTQNRDMNGATVAMPQYSDFVRFSHISKPDLTSGWSSTDTQYHFMDFWSSKQTVGSTTFEKGINVYSPIYMNDSIKFKYSGSSQYTNDIVSASWNGINGLLGVYGDNGAVLGYQNGSTLSARIIATESNHPSTGDYIRSWGNWNLSASTIHNGTFSGNHVNSYSNPVTRTYTSTYCIESEAKQVRVNFENIQIADGKAIINIPNKYIGINNGYIVSSIVKKGKGDVWVAKETENRFTLEATDDIKVNVEIIIKLEESASYELKTADDTQLCIDMSTGQPISN